MKDNMEFLVRVDEEMYEISELISSVSYTDKLNDGCSKLEFSYLDDDLVIPNGSAVRFKYNGVSVFNGFVFTVGRNKGKEITVTAYDQLRYCKAKDTIVIRGETVTSLVRMMCNYFKLKTGNLTDTGYKLPVRIHDDKTWLDIIYGGIKDTLVSKGIWHSLRDEDGSVALRNVEELKLPLVLGDESLCYDYEHKKSIDDSFYNQIKIHIKDSDSIGQFAGAKDESSIKKFGMLQYHEVIENANASQAKARADMLLKLYNRELETLSMDCLGDISIRAGSSFYGRIEDIKLDKRLIVREVKHNFLPVHTMSLEVSL